MKNGNSVCRKAVVLAAGLGTRLRPLTAVTPKPLMPVWGEPMLERVIDALGSWGVEEIYVNAHYLADQVVAWAEAWNAPGRPKVTVSVEKEILGTGGVLNPLRGWIGGDDFYLVNGDIVFEGFSGFGAIAPSGLPGAETIGVALLSETGPRTVEMEPESGLITNWRSDDAGFPGTYTYCGVTRLSAGILDYVEPTGFSSIVRAYERAMADGKFLRGAVPASLVWTDAGTVTSFIDLNRDGGDNAFEAFPQVRAALAATGETGPVEFLGARGSERVFFRSQKGVIILYDDGNRAENALYAGAAGFLAAKGMPVPAVLADLPELKTLVLDWGGSEKKMTLEDDVKVVEALAAFNALGGDPDLAKTPLLPPFDPSTWEWERELFAKHCLGTRFRRELPEAARRELENVASLLEKEPKALVHRDFQSTNVLWKNGKLNFIDFQGMRLGPAAYDLASFLYDPYVEFTEGERRALAKVYAKAAGREEIIRILPYAAVERLVQCLGAYGRLASVGQPQFGKWVLPALRNLLAAADEAGLDAVGALAEELIAAELKAGGGHDQHSTCTCGHEHDHGHHCTCGHDHGRGPRA